MKIYDKLQKEVENRSRYQEKWKSGKSNGVCGKNKEDAKRSRDSIEEDIEEYEEVSKQRKKGE